MKRELVKLLIEKYPDFFKHLEGYEGPIIPIQFGFECGDGWFWIIDNLMGEIYGYCKANHKDIPQITQVKEKFGTLRFYYNGGNELVNGMVWLAEGLSGKICEECGSTENVELINNHGWLSTRCDKCKTKKESK